MNHRAVVVVRVAYHHIYLLRCENTIPNVELAYGAHKGFNRVEALTPQILVLA